MNRVEKFLLNIVDETWNEVTESTEVPATDWAKRIIERANTDKLELVEANTVSIESDKDICQWERVNNGMMGFYDYEYKTSCNITLDFDKIIKLSELFPSSKINYCPYCGGELS